MNYRKVVTAGFWLAVVILVGVGLMAHHSMTRLVISDEAAGVNQLRQMGVRAQIVTAIFVMGSFVSLALLVGVFLYLNVQIDARQLAESALAREKQLLDQAHRRAAALAEINLAINQSNELGGVLEQVAQSIVEWMPADAASVIVWDAVAGEFVVSASTLPGQPSNTARNRVRKSGGATSWIIDHKQPLVVSDIREDPFGANPMLAEWGLRAYAGMPMVMEGAAVGVMYALDRRERSYREDELTFLSAIAARAAQAISKVRLYEQLQDTNRLLETRVQERTADLTASHQALRESEERFRQLAENSSEVFWFLNLGPDRVLYVSPAFETIWGLPAEELHRRPRVWTETIHPDDRARVIDSFETWINGLSPGYDVEYRIVTRAGTERWIHDRGTLLRDAQGRPDRASGIARDITDRRRAEQADRESRELLQATIDALAAHIAILDQAASIVAVNESWRRFAEANELRSPNCGVGMNYLAVCDAASQRGCDEARQVAVGLRAVLAGQRREFRVEYPCHSPQEQRWFQARVTRFERGGRPHLAVAYENITEIKRAELGLRQLSVQLLDLQDQERRRLARELHDVTAQNLSALTLNLSNLRAKTPADQTQAHELIADGVMLADQSLREIRTLSYLLHPPLLDEAGLLSALRWYADGFTKRSGVPVDLVGLPDIERMPREIETALFRVVQESLTNIHRHAGSSRASIQVRRDPREVALEIRDNGRGMVLPAEELSADDFKKLGVGIMGMRERIRQLGGDLQIQSGRHGTTVRATVPLGDLPA